MDLATEDRLNTRDTCGGTAAAVMRAGVLQRGVSDHIRGRGLGRPSGHFAWSLTPRDCCWRPLRWWHHQAGGTKRRPTTAISNLRTDTQLRCVLAGREWRSWTKKNPRRRGIQGGTPRAKPCSPRVFPLLIICEIDLSNDQARSSRPFAFRV